MTHEVKSDKQISRIKAKQQDMPVQHSISFHCRLNTDMKRTRENKQVRNYVHKIKLSLYLNTMPETVWKNRGMAPCILMEMRSQLHPLVALNPGMNPTHPSVGHWVGPRVSPDMKRKISATAGNQTPIPWLFSPQLKGYSVAHIILKLILRETGYECRDWSHLVQSSASVNF